MQFLYYLKPTRIEMLKDGGTDAERDAVSRHFAYLQKLAADGLLILAGRTQTGDERTFGISIFNAEDQAAAQAIMEADPAVREKVMSAELFPYKIAVFAPENALETH
jgi:uncharacterized protein